MELLWKGHLAAGRLESLLVCLFTRFCSTFSPRPRIWAIATLRNAPST
jgi:hypothetical protein